MTEYENREVHEISERLERLTTWARKILGVMVVLAMAAIGYAIKNESTVGELRSSDAALLRSDTEKLADIRKLEATQTFIERQAADRSENISRLGAEIKAQGQTLNRMDNTLSDLTRYLRDNQGAR